MQWHETSETRTPPDVISNALNPGLCLILLSLLFPQYDFELLTESIYNEDDDDDDSDNDDNIDQFSQAGWPLLNVKLIL